MKANEMSESMVRLGTKLAAKSLLFVLAVVVIVVTLVSVVSSMPSLSGRPLYDHNGNEILTLIDANFTQHVYDPKANENRIQLVQFYNSWCGHCIAFAPTFKQLAHQCRHWKDLMSISVVDCAQESNTKLCRGMDINVYPTLRMFWFSPKDGEKGKDLTAEVRTADGLQDAIISWIGDNWSQGVPRVWPDLMPVSAVSKEKFLKFLPIEKGIPVVLIVENEKSFLGREIILDLSAHQSKVIILRMLDSSQSLLNQLMPHPIDKNKTPYMLTVDNKDYTFKFLQMNVYPEKKLREMFTKVIRSEFIRDNPGENDVFGNDHNFQQIAPNKQPEDSSVSKEADVIERPTVSRGIHMSDLNNAIRYSLFQEIALKKKLNSTQLLSLKNYLSVLELHFPFQTDKMRTFVKYLNEWLSKKKAGVDVEIEDMLTTMKIYEEYYHFPEMKPWKECSGSDTKYRGYPCSMWTLFHTLTVAEYKNTLRSKKWKNLHSVLYAMRDYITDFFGCSHCAQHFKAMATDLESELIHPNSSVLWLWRAHNRVNKRLKGDPSEDPKHPKRPFPYRNDCLECYESGGTSSDPKFNEKNVLEYLLRHYSSENLIKDESELKEEAEEPKQLNSDQNQKFPNKSQNSGKSSHSGLNDKNTSVKAKWNYSLLNNMDYSLILFLYFSSAAIIVTLCVYLKIRVRKRGQKYSSLKSPLSFA